MSVSTSTTLRLLSTCALALASMPAVASAQPSGFHLSWVRAADAADCIDEAALHALVVERLGHDPFVRDGSPPRYRIDARIERHDTPDVMRIRVGLIDADGVELGQRTLTPRATTCRALDGAIVLLITTALAEVEAPAPRSDPVDAPSAPSPPSNAETVAEAAPTPAVEDVPAPIEMPEPAESPGWRTDLDLNASVAIGLLPTVALGLGVGLSVEPPRFIPLTVEATFWTHAETPAGDGSVRFTVLSATVGACPRLLGSAESLVALALCGQADIGWLRAEGHGFATNLATDRALVSLRALARLVFHPTDLLIVGVDIGAQAALFRDEFIVEPTPGTSLSVHSVEPVVGLARLRLGARFD